MVPEYAGNQFCRWIYPIVFGGGLVGGDQMEINVETKANTCGLLTSQESSKVSNQIHLYSVIFHLYCGYKH